MTKRISRSYAAEVRIAKAEIAVVKAAMRYHNYDPQNATIDGYQSAQAAHIRALDKACEQLNRALEWRKRLREKMRVVGGSAK
jgi:hypothetical protein